MQTSNIGDTSIAYISRTIDCRVLKFTFLNSREHSQFQNTPYKIESFDFCCLCFIPVQTSTIGDTSIPYIFRTIDRRVMKFISLNWREHSEYQNTPYKIESSDFCCLYFIPIQTSNIGDTSITYISRAIDCKFLKFISLNL